ncbi:MAG: hypothetical protein WD737_12840 [Gemmatimonadota bacterium]
MSLISFHRFLIAVGILFCAGYGIWELVSYTGSREASSLLIALAFFAGALGLGYYLRHLTRILHLSDESDGRDGLSAR